MPPERPEEGAGPPASAAPPPAEGLPAEGLLRLLRIVGQRFAPTPPAARRAGGTAGAPAASPPLTRGEGCGARWEVGLDAEELDAGELGAGEELGAEGELPGATAASTSMYLALGIFAPAGGAEAGSGATGRRWLTLATLSERVPKATLLQKLEEYAETVRAARGIYSRENEVGV